MSSDSFAIKSAAVAW